MKTDIILSGVGGQGILSVATIISEAAMHQQLYIKQSEVHGMSQRGGDVQSHLRISSQPIASDLIPRRSCDVIISLEPMEALRYLPYLAPSGWIITASKPFINIPNYPAAEDLEAAYAYLQNAVRLDVDALAIAHQIPRSANMILLGAAIEFLNLSYAEIEASVRRVFASKGEETIAANLKALSIGFQFQSK